MSAEEFVTEILHGKLGAAMVVMGSDFALGKDRRGDAGFLRAMGADLGFQVEIVPPVLLGNGVVSSTAIRAAVAAGDLDRANAMLGHPFALQGLVVAGDGVGREIGFPTANIKPAECQVLPLGGVYSVCVEIAGETWLGVANIGTRPTLGGNRVSIEVFVIDFKGDLYGQELEVVFQHRLRDEVRFASLDELKSQIARDVEKARASGGCSVLP
jgi:riboflavin kinase/FMN adenylyltransferase